MAVQAEYVIGLLGVIATLVAALVQRPWARRARRARIPAGNSLSLGTATEHDSFVVDELVKVLDLRESPGVRGTAVQTDSYRLRRHTDTSDFLISFYSTSGDLELESVSHPESTAVENPSGHMAVNKGIAVDLHDLAVGGAIRVVNRACFKGAYDKTPIETFETHIERPTRALTFILILSASHHCRSVWGFSQAGRREKVRISGLDGPAIYQNGELVLWRIKPRQGEWLPMEMRFQIEWEWSQSMPGPLPRPLNGSP